MCNTAVDDEWIGRTPCRLKGAANEKSLERPTITIAELAVAIERCPGQYRLAPLLATWCHLRRGEVLGLQRRNVDRLHRRISVARAWTLQTDGQAVLDLPKTEAGSRTLDVPPNAIPALNSHLDQFVGAAPDSWLVPGHGDTPVSPRTIDRIWDKARRAAGRPDVRFHDLCHSGLTWAATTGAGTAELMHRAGHKSHVAALHYQHATAERDRVLADAPGKLASKATVTKLPRTNRGHGRRRSSGSGSE